MLVPTLGNTVERAYVRLRLLAKRRVLTEQWAEFVTR